MFSLLIGAVISIGGLFLVLRGIPLGEVWSSLEGVHWGWALLSLAVYLFGHLLRGIRCALILRPHAKVSNWNATQAVWIGYAANNILPARLGELVRSWAISSKENISYGVALSTLIIERILDGLVIVGLLWLSVLFFPADTWLYKIGWVAGGIFGVAMAVVTAARLFGNSLLSFSDLFLKFLPEKVSEPLRNFLVKLIAGTEVLNLDFNTAKIFALSAGIWLVEAGMFGVMFLGFGLPFSLESAILVMAVTNLGVLIPSSPGHVGTFHFFCTRALLFTALTSSEAVAFSYAATVHIFQLLPITLLGLWALNSYGLNLWYFWGRRKELALNGEW